MYQNPNTENYEQISLFDKTALFTSLRIDRDQLPDGLYAYDIRHGDTGMDAIELKDSILVNHMGTVITKEPIDLGDKGFIYIEDEVDFYFKDAKNIKLEQFSSEQIVTDFFRCPSLDCKTCRGWLTYSAVR